MDALSIFGVVIGCRTWARPVSESSQNRSLARSLLVWHHHIMRTTAKPDPTPFENFQQFAKKVLSVPKAEIDRREKEYKKKRATAKQPSKHTVQH